MKAYPLKESLERLWTYRYEGAMVRYFQSWIDQLRSSTMAQPFYGSMCPISPHSEAFVL
jgi:hypothetical protein